MKKKKLSTILFSSMTTLILGISVISTFSLANREITTEEVKAATNTDNSKEKWSLIGKINGTDWDKDFPLTYNSNTDRYEYTVNLNANDLFKIRLNNAWDTSIGYDGNTESGIGSFLTNSGDNFKVSVSGKYTLWVKDDNVRNYKQKSYGFGLYRHIEYYVDTNSIVSGSNVYIHMWNASNNNGTSWPGVKMTNLNGTLYSIHYETEVNINRFIINNNHNTQTGNLTLPTANEMFIRLTNLSSFDTVNFQTRIFESWMNYENCDINNVSAIRDIGSANTYPAEEKLLMKNGDSIKMIIYESTNKNTFWVDANFNSNDWTNKFTIDSDGNLSYIGTGYITVKLSYGIDLGFHLSEVTDTSEINSAKTKRINQFNSVLSSSTGYDGTGVTICDENGVLEKYKTFFTKLVEEYDELQKAGLDVSQYKETINVLCRGLNINIYETNILDLSMTSSNNYTFIIILVLGLTFVVTQILIIKRKKLSK